VRKIAKKVCGQLTTCVMQYIGVNFFLQTIGFMGTKRRRSLGRLQKYKINAVTKILDVMRFFIKSQLSGKNF
jgi:hypothetical protein